MTRRNPLSVCGARGPGGVGGSRRGGGGSGGPGHGAEGPPRGKMNKGWLELESDPGEDGAGWPGGGGLGVPPPERRLPDHRLSPHQASSPSWWKISVRASPARRSPAVGTHSPALAAWPGAALPDFFSSLTAGVKGVQVEEIYDLQSKCQG